MGDFVHNWIPAGTRQNRLSRKEKQDGVHAERKVNILFTFMQNTSIGSGIKKMSQCEVKECHALRSWRGPYKNESFFSLFSENLYNQRPANQTPSRLHPLTPNSK